MGWCKEMWIADFEAAGQAFEMDEIDETEFRARMRGLGFNHAEIDEIIADLKPGETHAPL